MEEGTQSKAVNTESNMLVLTRKIGEGIVIGDDVKITIVEMKGGSVRIGIDAPRDKKIYRQEVFDRIAEENRDAANWNMVDLDSLSDNLTVNKGK
jgi:carbon storage regulator